MILENNMTEILQSCNHNKNIVPLYPTIFFIYTIVYSMNNIQQSQQAPQQNKVARIFRISRQLKVSNRSGKNAKICISPCPIKSIKLFGVKKLLQVEFQTDGTYMTQEEKIPSGGEHTFSLDNSQVYYTTLFECNGEWKVHRKNIRLDAAWYDLVLLPRHANDTENIL
jgi:hypothetical protein